MMRNGRRASKEPLDGEKKGVIALIGFLMIPYFSLLLFKGENTLKQKG